MLKFNELQNGKDYIAIGDNGKEYNGTFVDDYFPGGVFFCCYPDGVKLVGYREVEIGYIPTFSDFPKFNPHKIYGIEVRIDEQYGQEYISILGESVCCHFLLKQQEGE